MRSCLVFAGCVSTGLAPCCVSCCVCGHLAGCCCGCCCRRHRRRRRRCCWPDLTQRAPTSSPPPQCLRKARQGKSDAEGGAGADDPEGERLRYRQYEQPGELVTLPSGARMGRGPMRHGARHADIQLVAGFAHAAGLQRGRRPAECYLKPALVPQASSIASWRSAPGARRWRGAPWTSRTLCKHPVTRHACMRRRMRCCMRHCIRPTRTCTT